MGRDKLSLEVGGESIALRACKALSSRCEEVLVAGAGGDAALPHGTRRVTDLRSGREGPLAGMEAGFAAARFPLVFVLAGDMPFVPGELIGFLLDLVSRPGVPAAVPCHEGTHPLCAAYDREILPLMSRALDEGMRSARGLLDGLDGVEYLYQELRRFGDPALFLMNVNTPKDLERARDALGDHRA